jgi:16S rRNA (guanine527-N7)-methyltransferase
MRQRLIVGAAALGVELGGAESPVVEAFARYARLLALWNRRINLTAIERDEDLVDLHFLDSIAVAPHLPAHTTVVDVGCGAGFPGLPLKLVRPDLEVTLVESIQKKASFLRAAASELALRVEVVAQRSEKLVAAGRTFDVAVARAALPPLEWVRHGRELVTTPGTVVLYLGKEPVDLTALEPIGRTTRIDYGFPSGLRRTAILFHVEQTHSP